MMRSSRSLHALYRHGRRTTLPGNTSVSLDITRTNVLDGKEMHLPIQRSFSLAARAWDMVRAGSMNPPNPLLPDNEKDASLRDFTKAKEHHLVAAAKTVHEEYLENFHALEETLQKDVGTVSAEWLVEEINKLEEPTENVINIASLYSHLLEFPSWKEATTKACMTLSKKPHKHSKLILSELQRLDQQQEKTVHAKAVRYYLKKFQSRGVGHSEEETLESIHSHLEQVEARFLEHAGGHWDPSVPRKSTREQLEDMYSMVSLKTQHAKLLGYNNHAEYALSAESRMAATPSVITSLHEQVAEGFLISGESSRDVEYADTRDYLTLDGVLVGMFGLARALFGVDIREASPAGGWHNDVRLFHATDEATGEHMSSFYMDPYFRGTKARDIFVCPLGRHSMFLSANIKAPAWDNMPTPLEFENVLSLFHEFGHILQYTLAKKPLLVSVHDMPQDVSEMLPQFMEHFLFEESILESLAHLSETTMPKQIMEALQEQRLANKAQLMTRRAFLGQLELEVFMDGDESLVALQRRLAHEYLPSHSQPDKGDLGPVIEVMVDNALGKNVSRYRYLWSEVMSADIWTAFREAGVSDQEKMRELGMRLRKTMVEPGALLDGQAAFHEFRGRDMSPDAMFDMYGSLNTALAS